MRVLRGIPVAPGCADGVAVLYADVSAIEVPRYHILDADIVREHARFHEAMECAVSELEQVRLDVLADFGQAEAEVFSAHLAMLRDPHLVGRIKERVRRDLVNVEQAIDAELSDAAGVLAEVENAYFRERAGDLRDLSHRMLRHLLPRSGKASDRLPARAVVVARELLPSQTAGLDRSRVAALLTERGGVVSHAAILAKALGVPAVTGLVEVAALVPSGARVLVNGSTGEVVVEPTAGQIAAVAAQRQQLERSAAEIEPVESQECVTRDGVPIALYGNIGRPEEVSEIIAHHLQGVGLFRTEFLVLKSDAPPSAEEQGRIYGQVLEAMGDRPVVIRTWDLGGDKLPAFLAAQVAGRPAAHLRGLRFTLEFAHDLWHTQLLALARVARRGQLRVLFPMVLGGDDLRWAVNDWRRAVEDAAVPASPAVGAMIETPSSLFALDRILGLADFVSLGTNDLTRFMLATERDAVESVPGYSILHPAVLAGIQTVTRKLQEHQRPPACACGEAAGDPALACLLVGLGVRSLSMTPRRSAPVRQALRSVRCQDLTTLAEQALQAEGVAEVQRLLRDSVPLAQPAVA